MVLIDKDMGEIAGWETGMSTTNDPTKAFGDHRANSSLDLSVFFLVCENQHSICIARHISEGVLFCSHYDRFWSS